MSKNYFYLDRDSIVSGPFGSTLKSESYLSKGDVAFIRVQNIKGGFNINVDDIIYISNKDNEKIKASSLQTGDLILSKVGNSIGYFASVPNELGKCNISENNIGIKLKNFSENEKIFILTYLNTKYANNLVLRRKSGNAQPKINVDDLCRIPILIFPLLGENIFNIFKLQEKCLKQSMMFYKQAEELLNKELNITNIENTKNYSIKTFSTSFGKSKRFDAEYYQDKYDQILNKLKTIIKLSDVCHVYDKNFIPSDKEKYSYIELADINSNGGVSDIKEYYGNELPNRARRKIKKGQVLVSSIEGSLSSCALIVEDYSNLLCSNGFYVVDSDIINSETLLVLFKSHYIQMLLKQRCSGTILSAIGDTEFKNLPFVMIDYQIQSQISQKVQQSFKLRKQSKELLEKAVKAIEMAIEQGEEFATKWLKENTNEYFMNNELN